MAMYGRKELLALMGLAKAPPPRGTGRVDSRSWQAFKHRHNVRYAYLEDQQRRAKRRGEDGGDG